MLPPLQMVTAAAALVVTHGAKGRTVMAARHAGSTVCDTSAATQQQEPQTLLFPGGSAVLGDDAHDEELHIDDDV